MRPLAWTMAAPTNCGAMAKLCGTWTSLDFEVGRVFLGSILSVPHRISTLCPSLRSACESESIRRNAITAYDNRLQANTERKERLS